MNLKKAKRVIKLISWYPPYLGAGIRLKEFNDDFSRFVVEMKMRFYNRNLFRTHFGGSLYSMADPFFVFIVLAYMGNDYVVWDKAACIDFKRPGKGRMQAVIEADKTELQDLKNLVDQNGKAERVFYTQITNEADEVVAKISKTIYVRKLTK
ncbi:MAG: DUF4442 domain-containing protein [Bacteroidota bacterium]|nr:DUF4442 domain-containing protein [Bacteroidota bacterium]